MCHVTLRFSGPPYWAYPSQILSSEPSHLFHSIFNFCYSPCSRRVASLCGIHISIGRVNQAALIVFAAPPSRESEHIVRMSRWGKSLKTLNQYYLYLHFLVSG